MSTQQYGNDVRELLLRQLQSIADANDGVISPFAIRQARRQRLCARPSEFYRTFGSLQKAAQAAGVEFSPRTSPYIEPIVYTKPEISRMDDETLLGLLKSMNKRLGGISSTGLWRAWHEGTGPGPLLVRYRFPEFPALEDLCAHYGFRFTGRRKNAGRSKTAVSSTNKAP